MDRLLPLHSPNHPSTTHPSIHIYRYINWLQEACPSDGAEFTLLLERCARTFQDEGRYKQDPRYLKVSNGCMCTCTYVQMGRDGCVLSEMERTKHGGNGRAGGAVTSDYTCQQSHNHSTPTHSLINTPQTHMSSHLHIPTP